MINIKDKRVLFALAGITLLFLIAVLFKSPRDVVAENGSKAVAPRTSHNSDTNSPLELLRTSLLDQKQVQVVKLISNFPDTKPFIFFMHMPETDVWLSALLIRGELHDGSKIKRSIAIMEECGDVKKCAYMDVGANIGITAVPIAIRNYPTYAFEASIFNLECLRNNKIANKLHSLTIVHNAIGEKSGDRLCMKHDQRAGQPNMGGFHVEAALPGCIDETTSITLDSYMHNVPQRVYLMKVDVEGFEAKVMRGAKKLLSDPKRRPKYIMIEVIPKYMKDVGDDAVEHIKTLMDYGYKVYHDDKNAKPVTKDTLAEELGERIQTDLTLIAE